MKIFINRLWKTGQLTQLYHFTFFVIKLNFFVPFELNEDVSLPLFDVDPDVQFYNNHCNTVSPCDYYLEDSFNAKCTNENIDMNCFSMVHTNIRSISKNLNNFDNYLGGLDHKFSIIAVSESWLKDHSVDRYGLHGYNSEHKYRRSRGGGGVSIFVENSIEYFVREDLCYQNDNIETLFIEIDKDQIGKDKNVLIGVIYRPPDTDIKSFNTSISEILSTIKNENKLTYFLGDFNINLLNIEKHQDSQEFVDMMYSQTLFPNITKPTRVTMKSATLIDNIFSPYIGDQQIFNGILYTDITDHFPVFHIDYSSSIRPPPRLIKKRIFSQTNIEKFSSSVSQHNWDSVLNTDDPQVAYTTFYNDFITLYNDCFPLKTIKPGYNNRKPWLTEGTEKIDKNKK